MVAASVVIPVLDDLRVESLLRSLTAQTLPPGQFEIIVVDNAGNPAIERIAKSFPNVRYTVEPKRGSYAARNAGLRLASAEIIAFTDADCVAHPDWLNQLLQTFDDPEVGGVGGQFVKAEPTNWVEQHCPISSSQTAPRRLHFCEFPFFATGNAAYRKAILDDLGRFDEQFASGGDVDMSWRVHLAGYKIVVNPDAIVYHSSRSSISRYFRQHAFYTTGHIQLFKKYREILGRRWFLRGYPLRGVVRVLIRLPSAVWNVVFKRDGDKILDLLFETVRTCGMTYGILRGIVRYKVLFF